MSKDIEQPKGYTYKYKRLYDLGSDRMGIIDSMLTKGDTTMSVAEHIQFEWSQCTSTKIGTLEKQIQRYKRDILEPRLVSAANNAAKKSTSITKELKAFNQQVDVMDKLDQAVVMQHARILKAYAIEAAQGEQGKLDTNISKEIRALTDLLRVLAGLQLETGVLRRVPKQVQGFFQQLTGDEVQEFRLEMSQNDQTLKSLNMIKDVLQEAASEKIIDGEFTHIESESEPVPSDDGKVLEQESD